MKGPLVMAYYEFSIRISDTIKDTLIQRLSESGCLGMIENDESLTAYFPAASDLATVQNDLNMLKLLLEKAGRGDELTYQYALIPEQDWNESWKKGFLPVDAGTQFTILPPWEQPRKGRINLVIDPGMAFGTGHHETTRSCLVLMERYAKTAGTGRFLDLGTGSGILAIGASKLGFTRVLGVDTDILAVEAASRNIILNETAEIEIREGSILELTEKFDMIAANLISGVLVLLATGIAGRLNSPGLAILSGILSGQEDEVIKAMQTEGLICIEQLHDGKWTSLVVEKARS